MSFNANRRTQKTDEALLAAQSIAERNGNSNLEPEHLLYALLDQGDGVVPQVLTKLNVPVDPPWWLATDTMIRSPVLTGMLIRASPSLSALSESTGLPSARNAVTSGVNPLLPTAPISRKSP